MRVAQLPACASPAPNAADWLAGQSRAGTCSKCDLPLPSRTHTWCQASRISKCSFFVPKCFDCWSFVIYCFTSKVALSVRFSMRVVRKFFSKVCVRKEPWHLTTLKSLERLVHGKTCIHDRNRVGPKASRSGVSYSTSSTKKGVLRA